MACDYCDSVKKFSETGKLGGAGGRGAGPAVAKGAKPVVFELLVEGCSLLEVRSRPPMPRRRRSRLLRGRPRRRGPVGADEGGVSPCLALFPWASHPRRDSLCVCAAQGR